MLIATTCILPSHYLMQIKATIYELNLEAERIRNEADLAGFSPDTRGDTGVTGQNPALTFTPNPNHRNCADTVTRQLFSLYTLYGPGSY